MKAMAKGTLIFYLVAWTIVIGCLPYDAQAMLVPSAPPAAATAVGLQDAQTQLEAKMIVQRLGELGINQADIQERVDALTPAQIHEVAQNLDSLEPGGSAVILILAIIGAVVVILAIIGLARQA